MRFDYLPTIRAQVALNGNDASNAIEVLQGAASYELGLEGAGGFGLCLYPVYVRAQAFWPLIRAAKLAKNPENPRPSRDCAQRTISALAHLQIGRAYAMQGDSAKARAAYQDFLTLWKDADPDIPILKEAKAEYAKLQ